MAESTSQSIRNSTILQATLDWNSKIPACRYCGSKPNSTTILKFEGLPGKCTNSKCRRWTAYSTDIEIKFNEKRRQAGRWKDHVKKDKVKKVIPKSYLCLDCELIYENETLLQRHCARRQHMQST